MATVNVRRLVGLLVVAGGLVASVTPTQAYDRGAAASYADQWAYSRNSAYQIFNDDCTDFVSQALHAGGLAMLGRATTNTSDDTKWYNWLVNGWGYWSHSWSVVQDLEDFLPYPNPGYGNFVDMSYAPTGGGTTPLNVGDVLFYDWGQGLGDSHASSQVVNNGTDPTYVDPQTGRHYAGSLVDQHTSDRYHEIWTLAPTNSYASSTTVTFYHIN